MNFNDFIEKAGLSGKDAGDAVYAGLGALGGAGTSLLLGRLLHGKKYTNGQKLKYALAGALGGGAAGLYGGKQLAGMLLNPEERPSPITRIDKGGNPITFDEDEADRRKGAKRLITATSALSAGGAGAVTGYRAGTKFFDHAGGIPLVGKYLDLKRRVSPVGLRIPAMGDARVTTREMYNDLVNGIPTRVNGWETVLPDQQRKILERGLGKRRSHIRAGAGMTGAAILGIAGGVIGGKGGNWLGDKLYGAG